MSAMGVLETLGEKMGCGFCGNMNKSEGYIS